MLGQSRNKTIKAPCAYLKQLVQKELDGNLCYAHAHQIQHQRALAQHTAQAVQASNAIADQRVSDMSDEEIEASRATIARMREKWRKIA
jgi:hypothetical protein